MRLPELLENVVSQVFLSIRNTCPMKLLHSKVLSIVEDYNVSIEHIPSSIDSFSIVVADSDVEDILYEMVARIKNEIKPDYVKTKSGLALISTVGRNMSAKPGTSGKLWCPWLKPYQYQYDCPR